MRFIPSSWSNHRQIYWRGAAWLVFTLSSMAAVISAAKVPIQGSAWADTMAVFAVALTGMILGLIGLHPRVSSHAAPGRKQAPVPPLQDLLPALLSELNALGASLHGPDTLARLDKIQETYFLAFNVPSFQAQILGDLDPSCGQAMLDELARGERTLNRLWSVLSDGHRAESEAVYAQAVAIFTALQQRLQSRENLNERPDLRRRRPA